MTKMIDAHAWLERRVATGTQPIVVAGWLARAAEFPGPLDPGVAMFARHDEDEACDVWLLSPAAAAFAATLPGAWRETEEPHRFAWSLVYTAGKGLQALGLRKVRQGHAPARRRPRSG